MRPPDSHANRRAPTCVVLDQDAEEALQRAQQGAVDHDRLLALVVRVHVLLRAAAGRPAWSALGGPLALAAAGHSAARPDRPGMSARRREHATGRCAQKRARDTLAARPVVGRPRRAQTASMGPHHLEAVRQVEVELDGGALPPPPDRVLDLDVDLGAVEGPAALVHLPGGHADARSQSRHVCAYGRLQPKQEAVHGRWRAADVNAARTKEVRQSCNA